MKKLAPYFLVLSIIFTSCSSNENEVLEKTQEKLLQSYTLKRDGSGSYSIDFDVNNNTDVVNFKGNMTNDIVLSESNIATKKSYSNEYAIENDQLKIGFIENNSGKKTKISVKDDNITFAKGTVTEFLNSYSVSSNEDGTYKLDFKVNENVQTEFIYNEDKDIYEVHLSSGTAKQKDFSRELKINNERNIKLIFYNHKYSNEYANRTEEASTIKKPEVIIQI